MTNGTFGFAMKMQLAALLLIFATLTTTGQSKVLTADSDTVFWSGYYKKIESRIGLEPTEKIQSDFCFRFWEGPVVIELRQVDNKLLGTATFLLQEFRKEGRLYFKKYTLTEPTTKAIYDLVTKYKIKDLATDNQIKGWGGGLDGITYITEWADKDSYSFKNYWTPTHYQDKLVEAKRLVDFVGDLNKIVELNKLGGEFMEQQPFSSWVYIGQ